MFLFKSSFSMFAGRVFETLAVIREKLSKALSYKKGLSKMLMKSNLHGHFHLLREARKQESGMEKTRPRQHTAKLYSCRHSLTLIHTQQSIRAKAKLPPPPQLPCLCKKPTLFSTIFSQCRHTSIEEPQSGRWPFSLREKFLSLRGLYALSFLSSYPLHHLSPRVSISSTFYARLFIRKCFAKVFSNYILALNFLSKEYLRKSYS